MIRLSSVVAGVVLAACIAPESTNPAPRCASDADCSAETHCYRNFCVLDDPVADASTLDVPDAGPPCEDGGMLCGEECVDLSTDDHNCGTCENKCGHHIHCIDGSCEEDG